MSVPGGLPPVSGPPPAPQVTIQTTTGRGKGNFIPSNRMLRWILFGVIFPLVPIVSTVIRHSLVVSAQTRTGNVFDNGDWMLISVAIGAAAAGEVLGTKEKYTFMKVLAAGGCLTVVTIAAFSFGNVVQANEAQQRYKDGIAACFDLPQRNAEDTPMFRDLADPRVQVCVKKNLERKPEDRLDSNTVRSFSLMLLAATLFAGATCMFVTEEKP